MDSVIDLGNSSNNDANIKLSQWLSDYYEKDDLLTLFTNMDIAMKYIHSKGYRVYSFNPNDIEILGGSLEKVRFNLLEKMTSDFNDRRDAVREDVWRSSFLQIAVFSKCLNCLTPDFLKNNFNSFEIFLPDGVGPYYRGVIERNACVYLCDFLQEKRKRDLIALEKETGTIHDASFEQSTVMNANHDLMNTRINDSIYKKISSFKNAAYISFMMAPLLVFLLGIVFVVIALFSR